MNRPGAGTSWTLETAESQDEKFEVAAHKAAKRQASDLESFKKANQCQAEDFWIALLHQCLFQKHHSGISMTEIEDALLCSEAGQQVRQVLYSMFTALIRMFTARYGTVYLYAATSAKELVCLPHDTVILLIQFDNPLLVSTKTDAAKVSPMDYERPGQPEVRVDMHMFICFS